MKKGRERARTVELPTDHGAEAEVHVCKRREGGDVWDTTPSLKYESEHKIPDKTAAARRRRSGIHPDGNNGRTLEGDPGSTERAVHKEERAEDGYGYVRGGDIEDRGEITDGEEGERGRGRRGGGGKAWSEQRKAEDFTKGKLWRSRSARIENNDESTEGKQGWSDLPVHPLFSFQTLTSHSAPEQDLEHCRDVSPTVPKHVRGTTGGAVDTVKSHTGSTNKDGRSVASRSIHSTCAVGSSVTNSSPTAHVCGILELSETHSIASRPSAITNVQTWRPSLRLHGDIQLALGTPLLSIDMRFHEVVLGCVIRLWNIVYTLAAVPIFTGAEAFNAKRGLPARRDTCCALNFTRVVGVSNLQRMAASENQSGHAWVYLSAQY
ncbi:hypothetical protein C8R45DRAFT_940901 [Mycena sanguinolenta]|nr:hypothetical protein C8R45DRAFT_940901 [Mycena sanguinolenta]